MVLDFWQVAILMLAHCSGFKSQIQSIIQHEHIG